MNYLHARRLSYLKAIICDFRLTSAATNAPVLEPRAVNT